MNIPLARNHLTVMIPFPHFWQKLNSLAESLLLGENVA
jgi:hypothetical protein